MATPNYTSQKSLGERDAERAAEEGGQFTAGDWDNQHLSKNNPASKVADPSALALITFAITTGLLQVRTGLRHVCNMRCSLQLCFLKHQRDALMLTFCKLLTLYLLWPVGDISTIMPWD